jgi:hypothetical protein
MTISAGVLAYLRTVQRQAMTEEVLITNIIALNKSSGGAMVTEETVGPFPCYRVRDDRRSGEMVIGGQLVPVTTWKIGIPIGTPVAASSRLEIDGAKYEISEVVAGQSYETVIMLLCRRRE